MGLASNRNKAGMSLVGDRLASSTLNEEWIKRGSSKSDGNAGRPTQNKGAKNCTAKAAAHGTAQGAPCTEKKARD